jgi:hypothetical protein
MGSRFTGTCRLYGPYLNIQRAKGTDWLSATRRKSARGVVLRRFFLFQFREKGCRHHCRRCVNKLAFRMAEALIGADALAAFVPQFHVHVFDCPVLACFAARIGCINVNFIA